MPILLLIAGLVILVGGAELLVRGASRLATALGIAPIVVGLTVVAYGTSSPELAVSVMAAIRDQSAIALGNVVGSNIFNVLFILGISALIAPLAVTARLVRFDVPLMIAASLLLPLLAMDGQLGRLDALLLIGGGAGYTGWLVRQSRQERNSPEAAPLPEGRTPWASSIGLIVAGLAMLVVGAQWLVDGAVVIARWAGLSELVIGLTIVAAGTSLPELATSLLASLRGERDIAVGNIVGSNIFNLLVILGAGALVSGIDVPAGALHFDIPIMIVVALACLPVFFTGARIGRWEGAVFLLYYGAYVLYLVLQSTQHDALPAFSIVMLEFALPLTFLTLGILAFRWWRQNRSPE